MYKKREKIYFTKDVLSTFYDDARQTSIFCFRQCSFRMSHQGLWLRRSILRIYVSGNAAAWLRVFPTLQRCKMRVPRRNPGTHCNQDIHFLYEIQPKASADYRRTHRSYIPE